MSERRQGVRGRFYTSSAPATVAAMDIGQQRTTHQTGFRLVQDAIDRAIVGSPTHYPARHLRVEEGYMMDPVNQIDIIGFRLVWEDT